jgi:hypothetical protein
VRLLDTRTAAAPLRGPHPINSVIDVQVTGTAAVPTPIGGAHITAVAVSIVSVGAVRPGVVQAFPFLHATAGAYASFRVRAKGSTTASFAIVPLGAAGKISVLSTTGGFFVIDVLGWFDDHTATATTDGRFVPLATPERWIDTRTATPLRAGTSTRVPVPTVTAVPSTGVEALVLHVTADHAAGIGHLTVVPDASVGTATSTVNFGAGQAAGNDTIIGIGPHGTVDVVASTTVRGIVDVVGYITSAASTPQGALYVPVAQSRRYNAATAPSTPFAAGDTRLVGLTGGTVPAGSVAVSTVITMASTGSAGHLSDWSGATEPPTSVLNYRAGTTVAYGAVVGLAVGQVHLKSSAAGNVVIDVNGYFETPPV